MKRSNDQHHSKTTTHHVVTISTDEYADLLAARTRLEIVCDVLRSKREYFDKWELLLVARGNSNPIPKSHPKPDRTLE